MKRLFLSILILLVITANGFSSGVKTPEELIRAMHDKYARTWYKTLTFTQKSTEIKPDGATHSNTWYEAVSSPGKLRIDFDSLDSGNGVLFADDTQSVFKDGKLANSRHRIHPLLLLGFDVYAQPVEVTFAKLKELKFDMTTLREDIWQGRAVYVVGAQKGDGRTPQFWIDKERLLFVRLIEQGGKDGAQVQETQFNKYVRAGGGWVAAEVVFMVNGKRVFLEEYSDIRADAPLDPNIFDPNQWTTARRKS